MVINGIITGDDFYVNILLLMEYRLLPPFFATKIIYEAIYSSPLFILKRINHILVRSWSSYLFISIFQYVVYTFGAKACIFFFWKLFSTDCYHSHPPILPLPEPLLTPFPPPPTTTIPMTSPTPPRGLSYDTITPLSFTRRGADCSWVRHGAWREERIMYDDPNFDPTRARTMHHRRLLIRLNESHEQVTSVHHLGILAFHWCICRALF